MRAAQARPLPPCYRAVAVRQPPARKLLQSINGPAAEADVPHHRRQSWDTRCPRSTRQSFSAHTSSPLRRSSHSRWRRCSLSVLVWSSSPATRPSRVDKQDRARGAESQPQLPAGTRFDGGPDEGTRGLAAQAQVPAGTRFDGGPDEGSRGATSYYDLPSQRSSYQRLPPMAPRLAPVARACSRRVVALARPASVVR